MPVIRALLIMVMLFAALTLKAEHAIKDHTVTTTTVTTTTTTVALPCECPIVIIGTTTSTTEPCCNGQ